MFYIIADIHGYFDRLVALYRKIAKRFEAGDTLICLGDYIDRGPHSYEVIDFLIHVSREKSIATIFLKGNHEAMLMDHLGGRDDGGSFIMNGGSETIKSYTVHQGAFTLPGHHRDFFDSLKLYHEGDDFIAVHAGLNPAAEALSDQDEYDLLWIREKFFRADKRWDKTVIFGHTPAAYMRHGSSIYVDDERNIIGIDSGVIFGKPLSCLIWPERKIITG